MEFIKSLDLLVIGSRLNTLLETLIQDITNVYNEKNLEFEPRFFPVVFILKDNNKLNVNDLIKYTELSHSTFKRISLAMEEKGLIKFSIDNKNPRIKYISLSVKSKKLVPKLELIWGDTITALKDFFNELGIDVLNILDRIENGIKRQSMFDRIIEKSKLREINTVDIVDYSLPLKAYFKDLNYEWLKKHFRVEKRDEEILSNPEKYILETGGFILFARVDGYICGTAAMVKHKGNVFELAKMSVSEKYEGRQIGMRLVTEAIDKAKELGAKKIFLETNPEFTEEVRLFKKLGFEEVSFEDNSKSKFDKSTFKMELQINI